MGRRESRNALIQSGNPKEEPRCVNWLTTEQKWVDYNVIIQFNCNLFK